MNQTLEQIFRDNAGSMGSWMWCGRWKLVTVSDFAPDFAGPDRLFFIDGNPDYKRYFRIMSGGLPLVKAWWNIAFHDVVLGELI